MSVAGRAAGAWSRFWFGPEAPLNLAVARVVVAAQALWVLTSNDLPAIAGLSPVLWDAVEPQLRLRYLMIGYSVPAERVVATVAVVALLFVLIGLWTRGFALVAALALYHLAPYQKIFATGSPTNGGLTIAVLALVVLSASSCEDTLSVRRWRSGAPVPSPHERYRWPLRLIQIFVGQIYFFGFYGKIYRTGWAWFTIGPMREQMLMNTLRVPEPHLNGLASWLGSETLAATAATASVVVFVLIFEALFLPGVFTRWGRRIFVPMAFAFHIGLFLVLQAFFYSIPHLLIFVNWAWTVEVWRTRSAGGRSLHDAGSARAHGTA